MFLRSDLELIELEYSIMEVTYMSYFDSLHGCIISNELDYDEWAQSYEKSHTNALKTAVRVLYSSIKLALIQTLGFKGQFLILKVSQDPHCGS